MHYGCKLQSFNGKSDFTFFINHFTAIKSQQDVLFEVLNNFHPNILLLTIEVNPVKFLDTKIILNNEGGVTTQVYLKEN